jgi:hypothetical protein
VVPPTTLQNAAALLTVAMHAQDADELRSLIQEFRAKDDSDDLMVAVLALCRSLCFATSKLIHVIDEHLSDEEADALSEDELFSVALGVVRTYATAAARGAEAPSEGAADHRSQRAATAAPDRPDEPPGGPRRGR